MKSDVIVVGAGPAGASAAYFLAGAGIDVLLVDKYPWLLNRLVRRMQQDPDFALAFGLVVIGVESPKTVLSPRFLSGLFL